MNDPELADVVERELRLIDPQVRRSPEAAGALLHPQFHEFGASGRVWDRPSVIAMMAETDGPGVAVTDVVATRLAPDVVHLTYRTPRAHRSSVWRRVDGEWLVWFHQGTPLGAR